MDQFGLDRHNLERVTEPTDWGDNLDNDTYLYTNLNYGSYIGIVEMKDYQPDSKVEKAVLLRLNYNHHPGVDVKSIQRANDDFDETVGFFNMEELTCKLVGKELASNIKYRTSYTKDLEKSKPGLKNWQRKRDYNFSIVRNLKFHERTSNTILKFESSLSCKNLLPLKDNFSNTFKKWTTELLDNIEWAKSIKTSDFEILKFLANRDTESSSYRINITNNSKTKINSVLNRINLENVKEVMTSRVDEIKNIRDLMTEVYGVLEADYQAWIRNRYQGTLAKDVKVSVKGIDFAITRSEIKVGVNGNNYTVHGGGYYSNRDENKVILDRCLAYIISIGNEQDLLTNKLEEKLLMGI
jgi:hypothetical protein